VDSIISRSNYDSINLPTGTSYIDEISRCKQQIQYGTRQAERKKTTKMYRDLITSNAELKIKLKYMGKRKSLIVQVNALFKLIYYHYDLLKSNSNEVYKTCYNVCK
jgi:hypothetical protein